MTDPLSTERRILIVDDQRGITQLWKLLLERTGHYLVRKENHSRRALAAAHDFRPDLMLLDMDMLHLDGRQVAVGVRAAASLAGMAIVFLTSLVTSCEVAASKCIEGYPCLSKPTTIDELVQVIEENLAQPCVG